MDTLAVAAVNAPRQHILAHAQVPRPVGEIGPCNADDGVSSGLKHLHLIVDILSMEDLACKEWCPHSAPLSPLRSGAAGIR